MISGEKLNMYIYDMQTMIIKVDDLFGRYDGGENFIHVNPLRPAVQV